MQPFRALALASLVASAGCARGAPAPAPQSTLIRDVALYDGTGGAPRAASVRIAGDRIVEVGALERRPGEPVVDGGGLALAPGFIDTHSHADREILSRPAALADVSQGVTTVVVGQDGDSPFPLADFFARLERTPAAINVASYVGHGTLRDRVLGKAYRRPSSPAEIERMQAVLAGEMRAGALGLSSGLEYDPGIYSTTDELVALARTAAAAGGRYISHIRSEDRAFWPAIEEIIRIGREARLPVQVSHMKLAERSLWGQADSLLRTLDRARASGVDITADIYPYTYWQSGITVLFPARKFDDRAAAVYALREVAAADGITLTGFEPDSTLQMHTVAEIARRHGVDDTTALMQLTQQSAAYETRTGDETGRIIATSMDERDVARLIAWPHANICSDGELAGEHPRGYGAFTRVLRRYVRETRALSWAEAVHKMTALAAAHVGLAGRGTVAPGMAADLVLFDTATVADRATPAAPQTPSVGVRRVWVNGVVVYDGTRPTGARSGRVLRRAESVTSRR